MSGAGGSRPENPRTDFDHPRPWVIVVDAMDWKTAQEVGRALASCGVTGTFRAGTEAAMLQEYSAWKRLQARQVLAGKAGGNGDGNAYGNDGEGQGSARKRHAKRRENARGKGEKMLEDDGERG